jgi:hypothetical protein
MKVTVTYDLPGEKKHHIYKFPEEAKYFRELINLLKDRKLNFKFYYS